MLQDTNSVKEPFFDRFTATKGRPLSFQITVSIIVLLMLTLALTTALLLL